MNAKDRSDKFEIYEKDIKRHNARVEREKKIIDVFKGRDAKEGFSKGY